MAEILAGLGVAASVIAVIQISEQVITGCIHYFRTAKEAKTDIQSVIDVVGGLKISLENLKMILDETEADELPHLRSLDKPLEACCGAMLSLAQKLGVDAERDKGLGEFKFNFKRRMLWPWKEKEVNKILDTIEKHKATFTLAVSGDTLQTVLMIQADVGEISEDVRGLKRDVSEVIGHVGVIPTFVGEQQRKDILKWLKTNDFQTNHTLARQKHEPTTGDWFIQSTAFTTWMSLPKSTLWLYGIPGAGKTILCSTIIEHVKKHCGAAGIQFACFYFDYNDSQKETINGKHKLPSVVESLFAQCNDGLQQPSLQNLIDTFSILLGSSPQTYLIMDALDECCERDKLTELIGQILEASQCIKLLVTSRREQDLVEGLEDIMDVQINLSEGDGVDVDIERHDEILAALVQGASGMFTYPASRKLISRFRWVECQLESLKRCLSPAVVRNTLSQLPKTLDETYNRILKSVPAEYHREVRCALHLLVISCRPLTLYEVAEAVAVAYEDEKFDVESRLRDPRDILEMCSSLVSVSGEDDVLRFALYSVQEYLVSERIPSEFGVDKIEAHRVATKISLTYLISFDNVPAPSGTEFPFFQYAARFWHDHALVLEDAQTPELGLVLRLFAQDQKTINSDIMKSENSFTPYDPDEVRQSQQPRSCCVNWLTTSNPDRIDFQGRLNGLAPAWYYSSLLGLLSLTKSFFQPGAQLRPTVGRHRSALQAASARGHTSTVRYLLENNLAQVNEATIDNTFFSTTLEVAVSGGHFSVIEALLDNGADVMEPCKSVREPPLHKAVARGYLDVARYLLEKGADVNYLTPELGTALGEACRQGDVAIVKLLLTWGANLEWPGRFDNALQIACWRGYAEVVPLLLIEGANIHAEGKVRGDALQCACSSRERDSVEIVRLLLDKGANVNAKPASLGTALQCAVFGYNMIEGRLAMGVGPRYDGVFVKARVRPRKVEIAARSEAIVRLLLEHGAEVNDPPGIYGTALQAARAKGHQEVVELLLSYGAKEIPIGEIGKEQIEALQKYNMA